MRVLCAGHVNWDVTLHVDHLPEPDGESKIVEQTQSGGGSAANTASVLATLDVPTGILGSVGTDQNGYQARRELVDAGVNTEHLVETAVGTAVKYLVVDPEGEVMVLGNDRGNEAFSAEDVTPAELAAADHLHLTSQRPATAAELAQLASERGTTVSFDPGRRVLDRDYGRVLELTDYLFLTEREARGAVDVDVDDPDDRPEEGVLVIKFGGDGAEVRTPARTYYHPGYEIDPVDTTGAGDAFAGGFCTALLDPWDPNGTDDDPGAADPGDTDDPTDLGDPDDPADPDDPDGIDFDRALCLANACGAIAARHTGARVRIGRRDVERFLAGR